MQYQTYLSTQRPEIEVAHVDPIDADRALLWVVEAGNQTHECRLAGAGAPDDPDVLSGFDTERRVFQHRCDPAGVLEGHVVEFDAARDPRYDDRVCGLGNVLLLFQDFFDTLRARRSS